MAFCTIADVTHELHPTLLKQMQEHYGENFDITIRKHIKKARAFCESSLARADSYKKLIPIKSLTMYVVSPVCKIAAYYAAAAFSEKEEILIDKYNTAVQELEWLVEADNPAMVDASLTGDDVAGWSGASYGSDPRVFTREELAKW